MVIARNLDKKMLTMLKQGKSFFHMGSSGHEAAQLAAAAAACGEVGPTPEAAGSGAGVALATGAITVEGFASIGDITAALFAAAGAPEEDAAFQERLYKFSLGVGVSVCVSPGTLHHL